MKLEFLSFDFDKFAQEMQNLKDKKGFDYLVTIVGEDFGAEEGLGCVYILENTKTHERCSVKMIAKSQVCGDGIASNGTGETDGQMVAYLPTVSNIWRVADLLEREVYDFYGIVFLGHPDMRRLFLRSDFKGYPFRKDWKFNDQYTLEDDVEPDYGLEYFIDKDGNVVDHDIDSRVISLPLQTLNELKNVIAVSGGAHKVQAIAAALKAGCIDILITDEETARLLAQVEI